MCRKWSVIKLSDWKWANKNWPMITYVNIPCSFHNNDKKKLEQKNSRELGTRLLVLLWPEDFFPPFIYVPRRYISDPKSNTMFTHRFSFRLLWNSGSTFNSLCYRAHLEINKNGQLFNVTFKSKLTQCEHRLQIVELKVRIIALYYCPLYKN